MTWYPIAFLPSQYNNSSGAPYAGAVLKAYEANTTTPISMATDYTGATTAASFTLNASGYPISGGAVIIPHIEEDYSLALYPDQASADANSGAIWTIPYIKIAEPESSSFFQSLSGDNTTTLFNLSQDMGTDEKALMIFVDKKLEEFSTNGTFASDTAWTKGAGWTIAAGVATATGAISTDLSQTAALPIIQGEAYIITYTITRSAGGLIPKIGGVSGTERIANGTYTEQIIAGSTQALTFTGNGFTGTLDTVSIHRANTNKRQILRPDEFDITNNALTFNEAPASGTNNILVFAPSLFLATASASVDAAAASAAAALVSETNAAASEVAAELAETNAETAETNAEAAAVTAIAAAASASVGNISALSTATVASGDYVPFQDINDSNLSKRSTWANVISALSIAVKNVTQVFSGAQVPTVTALTSTAASIALDLAVNNSYSHTFTENTTLANPTNATAGQTGCIYFTQHASSPKTLALGSNWKAQNGVAQTVSATNSAMDTLYYNVRSSTVIEYTIVKGLA